MVKKAGVQDAASVDGTAAGGRESPSNTGRAGRPRKYSDAAEARVARAMSNRAAREKAAADGMIRMTVQIPAENRDALTALAKALRDSEKGKHCGSRSKRPAAKRTSPQPFGPTQQFVVICAWYEGGTIDELRAAGVNIEQACAWLHAIGEASSAAGAFRTLRRKFQLSGASSFATTSARRPTAPRKVKVSKEKMYTEEELDALVEAAERNLGNRVRFDSDI